MELLLVEDDVITSHALQALLRRLGFHVRHAPQLIDALEQLIRLPDIVVLDLPLLDGSGLEVLNVIRDTKFNCKIAVFVPEDCQPALLKSITSFKTAAIFHKPLDFEDFGKWLCDLFA